MRLLTAAQLAEGALRRIGALGPHDAGADADELDVALHHLDLVVGELAGAMTCTWLVPAELVLPLAAGTRSYDLKVALGADWPENGLQFPLSAWLQDSGGRRRALAIARRRGFLAHADPDEPGEPREVYIDRRHPPTLATWPVIAQPGSALVLHVQTFASDLRESGGNRPHLLPAAWQRWGELATAADIGDGPVRRLQGDALARLRQEREVAKRALAAHQNREHATRRAVAYREV